MPKTSVRPSSPMMRRSGARKVIAEERLSERKAQEQDRLVKENIKNRAIAALQQRQEEMAKGGVADILLDIKSWKRWAKLQRQS